MPMVPGSAQLRARARHLLGDTPAGPGLVAAAAVGVLAVVNRVDPNEPGHWPVCSVLSLTGLYCPGCGTTRMLHSLTEGDLAGALAMNPLALLLLPALGLYWLGWTRRVLTGASRRTILPAWAVWGFLLLVTTFAVLRNLPATAWLAPG